MVLQEFLIKAECHPRGGKEEKVRAALCRVAQGKVVLRIPPSEGGSDVFVVVVRLVLEAEVDGGRHLGGLHGRLGEHHVPHAATGRRDGDHCARLGLRVEEKTFCLEARERVVEAQVVLHVQGVVAARDARVAVAQARPDCERVHHGGVAEVRLHRVERATRVGDPVDVDVPTRAEAAHVVGVAQHPLVHEFDRCGVETRGGHRSDVGRTALQDLDRVRDQADASVRLDEGEARGGVLQLQQLTHDHRLGLPARVVEHLGEARVDVVVHADDQVPQAASGPGDAEHEASPAAAVLVHCLHQVVPAADVGGARNADPERLAVLREGLLVVQVEGEPLPDRIAAHAAVELRVHLVCELRGRGGLDEGRDPPAVTGDAFAELAQEARVAVDILEEVQRFLDDRARREHTEVVPIQATRVPQEVSVGLLVEQRCVTRPQVPDRAGGDGTRLRGQSARDGHPFAEHPVDVGGAHDAFIVVADEHDAVPLVALLTRRLTLIQILLHDAALLKFGRLRSGSG